MPGRVGTIVGFLALTDEIEYHLADSDADAVVVCRLETVTTFDLFLAQPETIAQQLDGAVGLVQNPVALCVR